MEQKGTGLKGRLSPLDCLQDNHLLAFLPAVPERNYDSDISYKLQLSHHPKFRTSGLSQGSITQYFREGLALLLIKAYPDSATLGTCPSMKGRI